MYSNNVWYSRAFADKEVDFVMKMYEKYLPIEVKYQNSVTKSDLYNIRRFINGGKTCGGIVITKNTLHVDENIILIPCYLFLTLI
jgi:predicted AAA+ superfamily ATPase